MEAGLEPWSAAESGRGSHQSMHSTWQSMSGHTVKWVQECRRKYNAAMRRLANKKDARCRSSGG